MDRRVLVITLGALGALALGACQRRSEKYCQNNPADPECGTAACDSDANCPNGRCDLSSGTCVDCLTSLDCRDAVKPICDVGAMTCMPCDADTDCPGSACLGDGSCPAESTILWVSAMATTGNDCSRGSPCTLDEATAKVDAMHTVIRVLAGTYDQAIRLPDVGMHYVVSGAHIEGAPTTIVRVPGGTNRSAISIAGGADVTVEYVEARESPIDGLNVASGASLVARHVLLRANAQSGLGADSATRIELTGSVIAENKVFGVYVIGGDLVVENNFVVANGSATQDASGVHVEGVSGMVRFNTIADNFQSNSSNDAPGLMCDGDIDAGANLITDNTRGTVSPSYPMQTHVMGGCNLGMGPRTSYTMPGTAGDDATIFANVLAEWGGFHLRSDAPAAIHNVTGFQCMGTDADGELRPMGGACDLGADEFTE